MRKLSTVLLGEFLHEAGRLQEAKAGPQTCELRPKRKAGQGVQSCLLATSRTAAVTHNALWSLLYNFSPKIEVLYQKAVYRIWTLMLFVCSWVGI